jgi:hypothetical protein
VTTAEVAVRDAAPLAEKIEYAKFLAAADLLPKAYQGKPANLLYAIEYGAMLDLPPIAAVVSIHIIDGKPTMAAGLMAAKVRQAGHKLRVQSTGTGDQAAARCTIRRSDDPDFEYSAVWTMDRAKTADLLGKGNWRKHPVQMLKNRAISECCRDACQEVLLGIHYTPDELGGDDDGGEIIDDGFATLPNGQLDQTQMSEQSKDQAGLMTRHQRVEHDQLRDMNKVNPADLEHVHEEPDGSDPWQLPPPPGPKSPVAPESWQNNLAKLIKPIPLGTDDDRAALLTWITGRPVDVADPRFTRAEVKLVADIVRSHLEKAEGDTEVAASNLWKQHAEATGQVSDDPA